MSAQVCVQAHQVDNKSSERPRPHLSVSSHSESRPLTIKLQIVFTFKKWHHSPADPCSRVMAPLAKKKRSRSYMASFEILSTAKGNSCSCTVLTKLAYCSNYFSPHADILLQLLTLHHWQTQNPGPGWRLKPRSRFLSFNLLT